jgi:hypothetical protein
MYCYLLGSERPAARDKHVCIQIPIGKMRQTRLYSDSYREDKVVEGVQKGKFRPIHQRCRYCSLAERYKERHAPGKKRGAIRTIYCCVIHTDVFMCKQGVRTCWQEHLASCQPVTS